MKVYWKYGLIWALGALMLLGAGGCRQQVDPHAAITFSTDTLRFDTVFTTLSSPTRVVMLHNPSKQPITISSVTQQDGRYFLINLDGEADKSNMHGIQLAAGDSLYLFVRAALDEQESNLPVLVRDQVVFHLDNGNHSTLEIEAFGQDVVLIDSLYLDADYTFTASKPYLIRYYIASAPAASTTIQPGTVFYMHKNAQAHFYGPLTALGTVDQPIRFQGDRLDDYIVGIPYAYVPGSWGGVYLYDYDGKGPDWQLSNVQITSASNGLYCYGKSEVHRPTLSLTNALIHNNDHYGLVLYNVDANVGNSEISNCASHCVYQRGGNCVYEHNTIASYYKHTQYNSSVGLYDTEREDVSAVYIDNLSKSVETHATFRNNIITGVRKEQLMIASPLPDLYTGVFSHNYLRGDTIRIAGAADNVYAQDTDVVFINDYYADYRYYDFRLDSLSPARGMADPQVTSRYPYDRLGNLRKEADAGCYAFSEDTVTTQPQP